MNRRTLLLAAPASLAACPVTAPAQPHATPIAVAYRGWLAQHKLVNINNPSMSDEEFDDLCDRCRALEEQVTRQVPQDATDLLMQLMAFSGARMDMYEDYQGTLARLIGYAEQFIGQA